MCLHTWKQHWDSSVSFAFQFNPYKQLAEILLNWRQCFNCVCCGVSRSLSLVIINGHFLNLTLTSTVESYDIS